MDARQRIIELMEKRGWTSYQFAKVSGLSHSTVSNMLKRNNAPSLPTLEAACAAFGITMSEFFAGDGPARLTEEQSELFSKWVTLTAEQKKILLDLMDVM